MVVICEKEHVSNFFKLFSYLDPQWLPSFVSCVTWLSLVSQFFFKRGIFTLSGAVMTVSMGGQEGPFVRIYLFVYCISLFSLDNHSEI